MRPFKTTVVLSLASSLVLLSACGKTAVENAMQQQIQNETGSPADVDLNADGSMQVTTKDGSFNAGSNKLPSDWPADAPVYAAATIQFSGSANPVTGKAGAAAVLVTKDDAADVVAFYKAELVKQGWKVETAMEGQGTTILGATKGTRAFSLMVGAAGDGQTSITIGVGEQ